MAFQPASQWGKSHSKTHTVPAEWQWRLLNRPAASHFPRSSWQLEDLSVSSAKTVFRFWWRFSKQPCQWTSCHLHVALTLLCHSTHLRILGVLRRYTNRQLCDICSRSSNSSFKFLFFFFLFLFVNPQIIICFALAKAGVCCWWSTLFTLDS